MIINEAKTKLQGGEKNAKQDAKQDAAQTQADNQFQKITIQKLEIYYQLRNFGETKNILVLHGWATKGTEKWQNILGQIAIQHPDYQIISLDLPGFGQSQAPEGAWGATDYSIFLKLFLEEE